MKVGMLIELLSEYNSDDDVLLLHETETGVDSYEVDHVESSNGIKKGPHEYVLVVAGEQVNS